MRIVRRIVRAAAMLLFGLAVAPPAWAQVDVDLELILAVDVSYSMDLDEQRLQRNGYIEAFRDPGIIKAVQSGVRGRIAVTYMEWAGPTLQNVVIPWTLIDGPETARAFADRLETRPISRAQRTSIAAALIYASNLFGKSEFRGARRVIDVSGDGPNNAGPPGGVVPVRDRLIENGIVINGLPILLRPGNSWGSFDISNLDAYYQDCVVGGSGSFMIPIKHVDEFLTATRQKLLIEISDLMRKPRTQFAQLAEAPPRVDCYVGEQMWRREFDFPR